MICPHSRLLFVIYLLLSSSIFGVKFSHAQVTNNSSALTNSAAPSASSVTTGGTNVNYQTNNQWSNEIGFGPGIFCRTPSLNLGGTIGGSSNTSDNPNFGGNSNNSQNASGYVGILVPFGSSVLRDCQRLGAQIVRDRQISTELSMIRACKALEREGIKVDPLKYPLLALCVDDKVSVSSVNNKSVELMNTSPNGQPLLVPLPAALHDTKYTGTAESIQNSNRTNSPNASPSHPSAR